MLIDHEEIIEICDKLISSDELLVKVYAEQNKFSKAAMVDARIDAHRTMRYQVRELVKQKKEAEFQPFNPTVTGDNINTEV
jgi:hypothetical protein